jgi:hypothetical protein
MAAFAAVAGSNRMRPTWPPGGRQYSDDGCGDADIPGIADRLQIKKI